MEYDSLMRNPLRVFLERIAYAGLKPSGPGTGTDRLDPLYLSNRSQARKILIGSVIVLPFALIVTGIVLFTSGYFRPAPPPAAANPTSEEMAAKILPNLKGVRIETERQITVMDAHITRGATVSLDGTLKNNVTRLLRSVEVVFDLTDSSGSQLGAVSVRIDKLESEAIANFHLPLKQRNAAHALFRESRSY